MEQESSEKEEINPNAAHIDEEDFFETRLPIDGQSCEIEQKQDGNPMEALIKSPLKEGNRKEAVEATANAHDAVVAAKSTSPSACQITEDQVENPVEASHKLLLPEDTDYPAEAHTKVEDVVEAPTLSNPQSFKIDQKKNENHVEALPGSSIPGEASSKLPLPEENTEADNPAEAHNRVGAAVEAPKPTYPLSSKFDQKKCKSPVDASPKLPISEGNIQNKIAGEEPLEKAHDVCKKEEKIGGPDKGEQKGKEKGEPVGSVNKAQQNRKKKGEIVGSDRSLKKQKSEGKVDGKQESPKDEKELFGGLICLCNAKTKPDCLRYQVMGMKNNRQDLIPRMKPGLKLFLYDFDLKLMHGIYQAASSGGLNLEPRAFGGNFPVQLRFNVIQDCLPLPESSFRTAMNEIYYQKNKFKTELTVHQVKKLCSLFYPADGVVKAPPLNNGQSCDLKQKQDENPMEASTKSPLNEESGTETIEESADAHGLVEALTIPRACKVENPIEASTNLPLPEENKEADYPATKVNNVVEAPTPTDQESCEIDKKKNENPVEAPTGSAIPEENIQDSVTSKEPIEKVHEISKKEEKIGESEKGQQNQKNKGEFVGSGRSPKKQKSEGKVDAKNKGEPVGADGRPEKQTTEGKVGAKQESPEDKKKEKLGGLICMCNTKTKPDVLRYQIMGMTRGKQDLVLGVKPGLKLFLYDFDLKLMYGIYQAASSGGLKLEPRAFGGCFPAQVRFSVFMDCFPVPEISFRTAMKEIYYEKNKFKTELTVGEVKKLCTLFHPAVSQAVPSVAVPKNSPLVATIQERHLSVQTATVNPLSLTQRVFQPNTINATHQLLHAPAPSTVWSSRAIDVGPSNLYAHDPYEPYPYVAPTAGVNPPSLRIDHDGTRGIHLDTANPSQRNETGQVDQLHSTYQLGAFTNQSQVQEFYQLSESGTSSKTVSSRYLFPGP